jgi:cytochrome c oxidase assembly factor CtaG
MIGDLLSSWTFDPIVVVTVLVGATLYARGVSRLARDGEERCRTSTWWRHLCFAGALLAFVLAACSPIDTYAADLFWVHMIQHLLLMMLVAPLFVAAAPWRPLWAGLPSGARNVLAALAHTWGWAALTPPARLLVSPVVAGLLFFGGMWLWHWPPLYDLALRHDVLHDYGEHDTFLLIATLFWLQIIESPPFAQRLGYLGRIVLVGATVVQNVVLSAILGLALGPIYAPYIAVAHRPGGISAHADQQFGAAIMWGFGDIPFALSIAWVAGLWVRDAVEAGEAEPGGSVSPRPVA